MGTISDKLTYLNTTKSQLKDMINYGLDEENKITSSTTFRNYVSSIFNAFLEALRTPDTLFTNLPKKSGSGAVISLNDTANAPMRIELGASELSQSATPTPSSPQAVHTISGNNTIKVFKNLIDKDNPNLINNYALTEPSNNKGWVSENDDYVVYIPCKKNTQYNITKIQSDRLRISTTIDNPTTLPQTYDYYNYEDTTQANYTTNSTANYLCIFFRRYSDTLSMQDILNTLIVYEVNTSQEADIDLGDIEYCKIGTYGDRIFKNVSGDADYSSERDEGAWYIKKNIGKVVLDGTEDGWNKNTEAISTNAYINNNLFPNRLSRGGTLCNYLNNVSSAIGTGIFSGGGLNFCFESSDFDTVEKFTTWLSTHNTIVYYQLATPTYTQITGTLERQLENVYQKLLSYTGTTTISQINADLPFNMSIQAIEDISNE